MLQTTVLRNPTLLKDKNLLSINMAHKWINRFKRRFGYGTLSLYKADETEMRKNISDMHCRSEKYLAEELMREFGLLS